MEERLIPFDRRTQRKHIFALRTRRQFLRQAIPLALFAAPAVCWLARYAETLLSSIVAKKAQTLRELAQERGIYIGTAAKVLQLQNEAQYRDTLSKEFDIITPELAMKFDAIHPQRYVYDFRAANTLVAFARKHAMQIRGHTLVWHKALPDWLTQGNFSNWELDDILQKHVETVIKQYRGQVQIWDVVNEAIGDNGQLRDTLWSQTLRPDYIDRAFHLAHEADPQARLFYNDYGGEGRGYKSDKIYELVRGLLKRNVPIHGVGLQMHVSLKHSPRIQDVISNMQRLTDLGLEVQVTEMDVAFLDDPRETAEKLVQQARIYHNTLSACLSVPNVTAFVMWGFSDRYYWIDQEKSADAPLIFNEFYQPKPAYYALKEAFLKSH